MEIMSLRKIAILAMITGSVLFTVSSNVFGQSSCLSWLWGNDNQETTIAPPFTKNESMIATQTIRPGYDQPTYPIAGAPGSTTVLGQSPVLTPNLVVQNPVPAPCTTPGSAHVLHSVSYPSTGPAVTYRQETVYQPEVESHWSYSRLERTNYKPVQVVDPLTGATSMVQIPETSKSLLPWPHRKETVSYKPVTVSVPVVSTPTIHTVERKIVPEEVIYRPLETTTTYRPTSLIEDSVTVSRASTRILAPIEEEMIVERRIIPPVEEPPLVLEPIRTENPSLKESETEKTTVERIIPPSSPPLKLPKVEDNSDVLPLPSIPPQERTIKRPKSNGNIVPSGAFIQNQTKTIVPELKPEPIPAIEKKSETGSALFRSVEDSGHTTPLYRPDRSNDRSRRTPPPPYDGPLNKELT